MGWVRDRGVSTGTQHRRQREVKAFFSWCRRMDYVEENPFMRVPMVRREQKVVLPFTKDADVLLAGYTSLGYELVVISADIEEGEGAWRSNQRQAFHYDDFLGRVTYGELHLGKNEESRLAHFIERVRNSTNKRFILTTREYILSEALSGYERLSDVEVGGYKSIVSTKGSEPDSLTIRNATRRRHWRRGERVGSAPLDEFHLRGRPPGESATASPTIISGRGALSLAITRNSRRA